MNDNESDELRSPSAKNDMEDEHPLIQRILALNLQGEVREGRARRAQHPKHHGCVHGRFEVDASVPPDLRIGVLREPHTFEALIRFSNGRRFDDREPDAHGMAIKLLGVDGAADGVQDFILVDQETFFSGDLVDYERINRMVLGKGLARIGLLLRLMLTRRSTLARMRAFASKTPRSPIAFPYFSTTPYALGDRVVKYLVRPTTTAPPAGELTGEDGLSAALSAALATTDVTYEFCVDVQTNATRQPIDDPSVAWSAMPGARRERVATLTIPMQTVEPLAPLAENISYSPWHGLPAHAPLGAINRARRSVYEAASHNRHMANDVDPPGAASVPPSYRGE